MARTPTRTLTIEGETKTLVEWASEAGICPKVVRARLFLGWSVERALSEPKMFDRIHRDHPLFLREEEPKAPAPPKVPNMLRPCVGGYRAWPISALDVLRRTA